MEIEKDLERSNSYWLIRLIGVCAWEREDLSVGEEE